LAVERKKSSENGRDGPYGRDGLNGQYESAPRRRGYRKRRKVFVNRMGFVLWEGEFGFFPVLV